MQSWCSKWLRVHTSWGIMCQCLGLYSRLVLLHQYGYIAAIRFWTYFVLLNVKISEKNAHQCLLITHPMLCINVKISPKSLYRLVEKQSSWVGWLISVILATWEAEIRRITIWGQSRYKVYKTSSQPINTGLGVCLSSQLRQER
jgi:hypothetical protein